MIRLNSMPASATITSSEQQKQHQQQNKQLPAPLSIPFKISYNIDEPAASSSSGTDALPAVKIDYTTLPATSPSIKMSVDLSNFAQSSSNNNNSAATSTSATSGGLDEDYDV